MAETNKQHDRFAGLRHRAEQLLQKDGGQFTADGAASFLDLIHELQVHQAELEIQNEELRRAEQERAELQHRYEALYEDAPCGYITLSGKGVLTRANAKAVEMLGGGKSTLYDSPFSTFIDPRYEEYYFETMDKAKGGGAQSAELQLRRKTSPPIWVQAEITADTGDDGSILQWRLILVDISARKATEISLEEKETMLREIHHRVKNNMQVISSLVSLQAGELPEGEARSVLAEVGQRMRAMALVHEKLYRSDNLARVGFDGYITSLIEQLQRANLPATLIHPQCDLAPVRLLASQALPCGLIVNELFLNAQQHAFTDGREGIVRVRLHGGDDGMVRLSICDNGVGLPQEMDWRQSGSLGLRLVAMLTKQLGAEMEVVSGTQGTSFTLSFSRRR